MSSTIGSAPQTAAPHWHHHRTASAASASATSAASTVASTTSSPSGVDPAASSTASNTAGAGIQKFAAELQSILVAAQSGQSTTSARQPTAGSTGATSIAATADAQPSSTGGGIGHIAERLQQLLNGGTAAASSLSSTATTAASTAAGASNPANLQSVLDRLQQTLQQTLSSYGASATAGSGSSITA